MFTQLSLQNLQQHKSIKGLVMFCVVIKDASGEVIEIYGPYTDTNKCLAKVDTLRGKIPNVWQFKIFNLYQ
jgi:hypothetical protein